MDGRRKILRALSRGIRKLFRSSKTFVRNKGSGGLHSCPWLGHLRCWSLGWFSGSSMFYRHLDTLYVYIIFIIYIIIYIMTQIKINFDQFSLAGLVFISSFWQCGIVYIRKFLTLVRFCPGTTHTQHTCH